MTELPAKGSAVTQFDSLVASSPNGRPSCEEVKRFLEVRDGERELLEKHIYDVCKSWGLDLTELTLGFPCVYSDGESKLVRAPNGNYLSQQPPSVQSYADYDQ